MLTISQSSLSESTVKHMTENIFADAGLQDEEQLDIVLFQQLFTSDQFKRVTLQWKGNLFELLREG